MPEARCEPGQNGPPADPRIPVTLTPITGNFGDGGGTIELISNAPVEPSGEIRSGDMRVENWDPNAIVAWLPERIPGDPAPGETFRVEATSGETTYQASPVKVTGPPGSGYPPTHAPV